MIYYDNVIGPSHGRPRKDSEKSNHSQEVFSGGEEGKDEPKSPLSPVHREDPVKLVPAPPPQVNAWNKRKTETAQKPGNPGDGKSPPQSNSQVPAKSESKSNPTPAVCISFWRVIESLTFFNCWGMWTVVCLFTCLSICSQYELNRHFSIRLNESGDGHRANSLLTIFKLDFSSNMAFTCH